MRSPWIHVLYETLHEVLTKHVSEKFAGYDLCLFITLLGVKQGEVSLERDMGQLHLDAGVLDLNPTWSELEL